MDYATFGGKMKSVRVSKSGKQMVYLPDGEGNVIPFMLQETPVMHPDLANKYPKHQIIFRNKFRWQVQNKIEQFPTGVLESMVVNLDNHKQTFMEPLSNKSDTYVLYDNGAGISEKDDFICETEKVVLSTSKTITPLGG